MNLGEMLSIMREKLDDPEDITFSLSFKISCLNESYKDLYFKICENQGSILVKKVDPPIQILSGTQEYDLPKDFGKVYGYPWIDQNKGYILLEPLDKAFSYFNPYLILGVYPVYYYISGIYKKIGNTEEFAKIGLVPIPQSSFYLNLNYIPQPAELSTNTDVFPIDAQWHELIVLGACFRCAETKLDDNRYGRIVDRWKEQMVRFDKWLADRVKKSPQEFIDGFDLML